MYKTTKEILMQPLDKRATPQDLIGVFASVHGLKASDVEIINPLLPLDAEQFEPRVGDVFRYHAGGLFRVRAVNDSYAACEEVVTLEISLVETSQFAASADARKAETYVLVDPLTAHAEEHKLLVRTRHDDEILRDINSWALVDKWVGAGRMFMGGDAYLQMSAQLQNQNAELFIALDERKTVKIVSTWLPQLVNKELMAELIVHPQFRKLTDAGHLFILTDAYASKLLELHAAEDEYNRLEITNNEPRRLDELIWKRGRSITISKE